MIEYLSYMDRFGLAKSGIIHIGANNAAECKFYAAYAPVPVAFFEPIPDVFEIATRNTSRYPRHRVFHACCSDKDGEEVTFNISSSRGMASSMFPLGRCAELHPGITYVDQFKIKTSRAETVLQEHYPLNAFNLAVIDTQGADLIALKGLGKYIDNLDAVYIEVSDQPLYEGGATFDQIYQFLNERGFCLAMMYLNAVDWGNAFFKRRKPNHLRELESGISVNKPVFMSSVHKDFKAEFGNDGNIADRRKIFCTKKEQNPWWKVDLGAVTPISQIHLYDFHPQIQRSASLVVETSEDDIDYSIVYDRIKEPILMNARGRVQNAFGITTIQIDGAARWVRLRLRETDLLHLRQVVVVAAQASPAESAGSREKAPKRARWLRGKSSA